MVQNIWYASCINPFMDKRKHPTHGTDVLIENKTFNYDQNKDVPCVYKKVQGSIIVFMILYINDILLIDNDIRLLSSVKI